MNKTIPNNVGFIILAVIVISVVTFGFFAWQQFRQSMVEWPLEDVVQDPETGVSLYMNRLVIFGTEDSVKVIAEEFGGKIVYSIQEISTYEVEFVVSSLEELDQIRYELEERGIEVLPSIVMEPPDCGKGPC